MRINKTLLAMALRAALAHERASPDPRTCTACRGTSFMPDGNGLPTACTACEGTGLSTVGQAA